MDPRPPQGPIQRTFAGLVGLLGLRGSGITPNSLGGVTTPVIDVEEYLIAGQYRVITFVNPSLPIIATTTEFAQAGTGGASTVPAGKAWIVKHLNASIQMAAGDTIRSMGVSLSSPPGIGTSAIVLNNVVGNWTGTAGDFAMVAYTPPRPLVLSEGFSLGVNYNNVVMAGALPFWVTAWFTEVQGT